ncbi:hypothetical protein BBBOND_0302730 [Babesia bigemina]|uniref:Uncharacterized protein n=1 Tax=Babesia bigemina TaxID=5866 RepID=A0A061DBV9_BABBI|nr:hypothetical protein BBBOND_0302730 [Babesia bigemina]CDR96369.1 hypothetical protein BBBOND_0302730 [Babesia bigemina]|eukprot:XP_012768555.1 hypothetical protein BBBOND_0302730 [Babesia bigemina]
MQAPTSGARAYSQEALEKRIQHLAEAAAQLASTLPSVSHGLMRQALRHLKDANGFRRAHAKQKKDKGRLMQQTHVISHKTVMSYECQLCKARTTFPGALRTIPINKKAANKAKSEA